MVVSNPIRASSRRFLNPAEHTKRVVRVGVVHIAFEGLTKKLFGKRLVFVM